MGNAAGQPNILIVEEPVGGFGFKPEDRIEQDLWFQYDVVIARFLDGTAKCLKHRAVNKEQVEVRVVQAPSRLPAPPARRWGLRRPKPAAEKVEPMALLGASD